MSIIPEVKVVSRGKSWLALQPRNQKVTLQEKRGLPKQRYIDKNQGCIGKGNIDTEADATRVSWEICFQRHFQCENETTSAKGYYRRTIRQYGKYVDSGELPTFGNDVTNNLLPTSSSTLEYMNHWHDIDNVILGPNLI